MANGGQARGTPNVAASQGLTPQISIVNSDGTPTMFFFRWLMTIGGKTISTAQAASDLESLEPYDAGADAALAAGALDRVRAAGEIAGAFAEAPDAPAGQAAADAMLAAWLADNAPLVPDTAAREIRDVLGKIPLPSTLNVADAGLIFTATDYMHRWRFDGVQWAFLEGDASGYVVIGQGPDSTAPNGGLWGLCDGSGYNVAQPDGTVKTVATIPMNADVFITGGNYTGINQATSPTWAAGAQTDLEAAHTHAYDVPGTSVAPGTGTPVTVGGTGSFETGPGSAHSHTLSGSAALNPPTVANGGLPKYIGVSFYIRR